MFNPPLVLLVKLIGFLIVGIPYPFSLNFYELLGGLNQKVTQLISKRPGRIYLKLTHTLISDGSSLPQKRSTTKPKS